MAAHCSTSRPALGSSGSGCQEVASPPGSLSAEAAPFSPRDSSDADKQFSHCYAKIRGLRPHSELLRDQLNLLFDKLLSENYNKTFNPDISIRPEDVCTLLKHASSLVPFHQEHLVVKFCQLMHHLLNQLKVIMDELTLNVLMNYVTWSLKKCSAWTHSDVLLALSTVVYENGPQCHQHLEHLLGENGVLLEYSTPTQQDLELQRVSLNCMANICLRIPGQAPLDDQYRLVCFRAFLKTLHSPKPANAEELFYCMVLRSALKGLQYCLSGGRWKFGSGDDLGSVLAVLKQMMFQGSPGVSIEWPSVLYPAPLPPYEGPSSSKPPETPKPKSTTGRNKPSANKKWKSRGKGKKNATEETKDKDDDDDEDSTTKPEASKEQCADQTENVPKLSSQSLYPSWKQTSSDSELSDPEGGAQSKLRLYHVRVRQGALLCLLAAVKSVEKRSLYGYWSSFIPDSPIGGPPQLTLLTTILKDPSPKVRACALQVLSAMLDGSRQFLAVAEDVTSSRPSYTSFSFSLATSVRELHRSLSLALLAETSPQTLTQIIKCLAYLVSNAPYQRLKPGLLSPLWKQIRSYVRYRDVDVRVSVLTLYGALVTTQAPLSEVQLLLRQPESSSILGSYMPQDTSLSWRQREGVPSPCRTPVKLDSPLNSHTPKEDDGTTAPWLLQMCVSLITQPRESLSDSEDAGTYVFEPLPVRLQALQVLSYLVRGYFSLCQSHLFEIGQVSARCLSETDASIQLHGTKLLDELGTGIIQQYRAENNIPENQRIPIDKVVTFWSEVLSGPLNAALQNEQHPSLQTSACDTLSSILPQAFALLPDKTQLMCVTVLLGLTYSENYLVKTAAVRALGIYIIFPCLREDVMFVADTANTILAALEDRSPNVRVKAAWSLGNLTDTLTVNMESECVDFREELSDMLLLKMLQTATRASADKDRVKSNAVRALGNLLHFLRGSQLSRSVFKQPLEDAVRALVKTVQSEAIMKVRWNACYALGKAFRNPALPLESASWSHDAFSALCNVVTSCKNFKVRIKSAAALSVPAQRRCYGDAARFFCVWQALATALENSEDTNDFLEYRYSASLRHTLSQALLHLLSLSQAHDMAALAKSLAGAEGAAIRVHLVKYLRAEEGATEGAEEERHGDSFTPQERVKALEQNVVRLRALPAEMNKETVVDFLEDLLKSCDES
ncbi:unnamed protein product [Knipowitschia caucasica]|uniref:HEAT repeat-containing protein 6 n=1 Tax=Knipowitschia caucasica TaxID=637954 RepID=A0AAV2J7E3_KNICA